jgi:hypothetical protein
MEQMFKLDTAEIHLHFWLCMWTHVVAFDCCYQGQARKLGRLVQIRMSSCHAGGRTCTLDLHLHPKFGYGSVHLPVKLKRKCQRRRRACGLR